MKVKKREKRKKEMKVKSTKAIDPIICQPEKQNCIEINTI